MPSKLISIGELIDQTWERFREHTRSYLSISIWIILVAILNVIAISFYPSATKLLSENSTITGLESFGIALFAFSSIILAPLLNVFVLVGIIRLFRAILAGRGTNLKRAVSEIKQRFWPAALISIMYLFIVLLAGLIPLLPAGIAGLISLFLQNEVLLSLANILLILGIFFSTFLVVRWGVEFYLAPYLVIQEDQKVRVSLMNSRTLVRGRFWQIFLRIIAPKIVFVLFGVLMIWLINILLTVVFSGISGLNVDVQARLLSYSDSVIPIFVTVFIQPLVILSDVLLLKSLKED